MRTTGLWLGMVLLALIVPVALAGRAQAQSLPPSRFFGSVTIDGKPAPWGTVVVAEINGTTCSRPKEFPLSADVDYGVDVDGASVIPGCGMDDAIVFFRVGERYADQVGSWAGAMFIRLDLTIRGAGARPAVLQLGDEVIALAPGCNNVTLPVAAATPLSAIAAAVTPAQAVVSIARYRSDEGRFVSYSPAASATANAYTAVAEPFEPVYICTQAARPPSP